MVRPLEGEVCSHVCSRCLFASWLRPSLLYSYSYLSVIRPSRRGCCGLVLVITHSGALISSTTATSHLWRWSFSNARPSIRSVFYSHIPNPSPHLCSNIAHCSLWPSRTCAAVRAFRDWASSWLRLSLLQVSLTTYDLLLLYSPAPSTSISEHLTRPANPRCLTLHLSLHIPYERPVQITGSAGVVVGLDLFPTACTWRIMAIRYATGPEVFPRT